MDDPEPDTTDNIMLLAVFAACVVFCFLLTLGTSALKELSEKKLRESADDGKDKTARRLARLLEGRPKPTDTAAAGTALGAMLSVASALLCFLPKYAESGLSVSDYGKASEWLLCVLLPTAVTVILSAAVFAVFASMVPRRLGKQDPEKNAYAMSGVLLFAKWLLFPFTWFTSCVARILVKIFGGDPHADEAPVTEDEILSMVDEGEETGVLEEMEKEMINNIFEFGDLTAGDIMTHRTYLTAAEQNDELGEVIAEAIEAGCSRIPVYEEELDNIKGVLYVKDLLRYVGHELPKGLKPSDVMREAMFIPESKKCRDLFTEMTEKHLQMVIVTDEYGGVAGVVTVEDLTESIVGNIQDEFDDEDEEIEQSDDGVFNIDGTSAIDEVEELLGIELPEGEYETVAGYMMSLIGRVPEPHEHPFVEYGGFRFTAAEVEEHRITKVKIERLPEEIGEAIVEQR